MSVSKRLSKVLDTSDEIPFDDSSKFIFLSDCHRGNTGWADDFAHNQHLFFYSLYEYYDKKEFTYIELGDGDELWENKRFAEIISAYKHVFRLLSDLYKKKRFYMIHGNHDIERKKEAIVERTLYRYYDHREKKNKDLFPEIKVNEGLKIRYKPMDKVILLTHGHQGDFWSDKHWKFSRFMVRRVWKSLQLRGFKDPTSPAKNFRKQEKVQSKIMKWAGEKKQMIICGHTHRSVFPNIGEAPYFNTGSCVHPRCITGVEIENGEISLIKWMVRFEEDGCLCIKRDVLEGPQKLQDYLS